MTTLDTAYPHPQAWARPAGAAVPELSVVIPAFNEADSLPALIADIETALHEGPCHEVIVVDDGSADHTVALLGELVRNHPHLIALRHDRNLGQSAAIVTGVHAARAEWVATLDADGQNDPGDIPRLLAARETAVDHGRVLLAGNRLDRHDSWLRRFASRTANTVRSGLLKDGCPDTGCGLKLFPRQAFLQLPRFDHMHRFLPALFQRAGCAVINVPVHHRHRLRGKSKYGIWNRLWVGLVDLAGVMWLQHRAGSARMLEQDAGGDKR